MESQEWLGQYLGSLPLEDPCLDYLYRRGSKEATIENLGFKTWIPLKDPAPCFKFRKQFGNYGENIANHLICPLYSPSGILLGFECRSIEVKWVERYLIPHNYRWTPVFLGMSVAMDKIWNGSDVWLVEGIFDLIAMEWVVPSGDAILGTLRAKVTDLQLTFLSRFCTSTINMVYDRDETGTRGTLRALKDLERMGLTCREIPYRGGNDPGEIWDRGGELGLRQAFNIFI